MPKLLQIDACSNWGSTGKIVEQIGLLAESQGWEVLTVYSRFANPSKLNRIKVGNKYFTYEHYFEHRFLDREGLASRIPTRKLLRKIKKFSPDVIQLHDIHDHWLNYPMLFRYLIKTQIPVVWTQHDSWSFTGHCAFPYDDCDKWKVGCSRCPHKASFCLDQSKKNYDLKKRLFLQSNMTVVSVSEWLGNLVNASFFRGLPAKVIPNGIDVNTFKPLSNDIRERYGIAGKFLIIGAATLWDERKGISDYAKLRSRLDDEYAIVMVGLTNEQIKQQPEGIIGLEKTKSVFDLVALYSAADVVLSLSKAETFGLTMAEAMACGTPVIGYNNTTHPEIIKEGCGFIVETGDIESVKFRVEQIKIEGKASFSQRCIDVAQEYYNKDINFNKYISLYNSKLVGGGKIVLGVATAWGKSKGLYDYYELSEVLSNDYQIVLLGLTKSQISELPSNIVGIEKTSNILDLVYLYNMASVVTSLSYGETFGLTLIEAMACGTPVVAYDNTGQAALVTDNTGLLVETGNIGNVSMAINKVCSQGKSYYATSCRNRAVQMFDKNARFKDYINLYNELISN